MEAHPAWGRVATGRRRPVHGARRRHRQPGLLHLFDQPADRAGQRDVRHRRARLASRSRSASASPMASSCC
jgi:hypothetical protein